MKEAMGTSLVFSLIMLFIAVLIAILVGSISFSKGFKIRNRIIDRIEEYQGFDLDTHSVIQKDLKDIGYKIVSDVDCKERDGGEILTPTYNDYNYCVYRYSTTRGNYYGVTIYIQVDIPLIGEYIKIPVYGETRVIYEKEQVKN